MTLYEDEVNFDELAARDPEFAATVRANDGRIDFQDPRLVKYKISPRSAFVDSVTDSLTTANILRAQTTYYQSIEKGFWRSNRFTG